MLKKYVGYSTLLFLLTASVVSCNNGTTEEKQKEEIHNAATQVVYVFKLN